MGLSLYPPPAGPSLAPVAVNQQSTTVSFGIQTDWHQFLSSEWQSAFFVVPPSGKAFITIGASVRNTNTTTSTIWLGWSLRDYNTGSIIETRGEQNSISIIGNRLMASRRVYRSGLTPGATLAVDPYWNISSSGDSTVTYIKNGQILVEPVA